MSDRDRRERDEPRRAAPRGVRAAFEAVPAGYPSPAQDYFSGTIDLNEHLISDPSSTFLLRVTGESMVGAGIFDGDEILVDRSLEPRDGRVVVAVVDGQLTVKRLRLDGDRPRLVPENPAFPTIEIDASVDLAIWGVVTRCLHRV